MQNQTSEIQSANSSEPRHQMFWEDLNNSNTTQSSESYSNKFKRLIPKYLLKPSDFMEPCSDGKTILENIAEKGHSDIIKDLFDNYDNIDIDKKYNEGNTLLHIAVKNGNSEMAEFLIKKGARIEILSDGHQIPLTLCPPENTEIKKLLQTTLELDSYLHQAIKNQNIEEIRELLDRGARPNGGITKEVEEQTGSQSKVRKGKFVSNIRLAIESDSSDEIIGLLMSKYVKTTSNLLEIACSSDKENLFKYLGHEEYHHFFEKNIPNLLNKSIQHGSVNMVKYFLNDYDINYKYENELNNNALQVAISNQFHFKTDDEKVRGKEIIKLLIDKIIEKYPQHEEVLSSKNTNGINARFMLSHMGEIGKDLLGVINRKIEEEKQKENDRMEKQKENERMEKQKENERIKRQKEFEDRTQKRQQELEEGITDSNPICMTALCCCLVNSDERVVVKDDKSIGIAAAAELVFQSPALPPKIETKMIQENYQIQQSIAKSEVEASNNTNSMQKISSKEAEVRSDSPRDNPNSVEITLATTPALTPSKPSQGGGMPRAIETSSSTMLV
jgi:ankyrin repeat protein